MELQIPSFPLLLSFFLFLFMLLNLLKKNSQKSKPPPGPFKYPVIGNLPQLMGGLPHHRLLDLSRKYGPVMSIKLGEVSAVVISSADAAKEVLKTQDATFADRSAIMASKMTVYDLTNHILFAPYGDRWRQMRKLCTLELLSAKRVQSLRSVREKEVSKLITFIHSNAGSQVNLTNALTALTNTIISKTSLGEHMKDQQRVLEIISEMTSVGMSLSAAFPILKILEYFTGETSRLQRFFQEIDQRLQDAINEKRASMSAGEYQGEPKSLLDVLLDIQDNGNFDVSFSNDNIKAMIMEMLGAGTESSAKAVEWAIVELLRSPKALKKAQEEVRRVFGEKGEVDESKFQELKYLKMVVKETMRLHPAGPFVPRSSRAKTKVNGYDIDANTLVLVHIYAIQRDPDVWNEAEKFWPERFEDSLIDFKGINPELIPFGAGKRICPGLTMGVANVELILANLLYHFEWKLPDGVTYLDVAEDFGSVIKRSTDVNLIPVPFNPLPKN